jgi:aminoglycoside phosphotransferase (APT) family kinase protein
MSFDWVYSFLSDPSGWPHKLYEGHYNRNYVVCPPSEVAPVLVRVPRNGFAWDLRCLPESQVLEFLDTTTVPAPRLLYISPSQKFMVLTYIPGDVVKSSFPPGICLPEKLIEQTAQLVCAIHKLDVPRSFYERIATPTMILEHLERLYHQVWMEGHSVLFAALGMPEPEYLVPTWLRKELLKHQPALVFAHCDMHLNNIIIQPDGLLVPVDWELAAVTLPAHDLATHLHRSGYAAKNAELFLKKYGQIIGLDLHCLQEEVIMYRHLEMLKSVIVDAVRTVQRLQIDPILDPKIPAARLTQRLQAVDLLWRTSRDRSIAETSTILHQQAMKNPFKFPNNN